MDPAREQVRGETLKFCQELDCEIIGTEHGIPCKRAEAVICLFKHRITRRMYDSDSPAVFWCYCGKREAKVMNATIKESPVFKYMCQGQVPESVMTGQPTDISAISAFSWWEPVMYKKEGESFPFSPFILDDASVLMMILGQQ